MPFKLLMISTVLCLASCAHVQQEPISPPASLPQLPVLSPPAPEPSFTERMQNFLQGKLPEPTK